MHEPTSLKRAGLLLAMIVCLLPFAMNKREHQAFAASQNVGWGSISTPYSNSGLRSLYPDIKYDSNGKTHIGWIEYGATDADAVRVLYTNNVSGSWLTPYEVSNSAGRGTDPLDAIALEGNRVHFLYITNGNLTAHRYLTVNGSQITKSPVTILSQTKSSTPELLADSSGRIHAFWGDRRANANGGAQAIHRIWANGSWESNGGRIIRNDGSNQRYISATQTSDGVIHVAFQAQTVFRYASFNGASWVAGTDLANGSTKQIAITSKGNTVAAIYSVDSGGRKMYYQIGYGSNWSNRVLISSGASFDEFPEIVYNSAVDRVYALWLSGPDDKNLYVVSREIIVGGGIANIQTATSSRSERKWLRADTRGIQLGLVWADKATGIWGFRLLNGNLNGEPEATPTPTLPPVGFTLTRSSASPSTNPNVSLTLANLTGSPDQMRVSTTPFSANAATPAWEGLNTNKVVNTGIGVTSCATTIYVQVRNSSNGGISTVQSVGAVIDSAVQTTPKIYTVETTPSSRPATMSATQAQPFAPDGASDRYTRNVTFGYSIPQETSGCTGISRHKAGPHLAPITTYPHSAFASFDSFSLTSDSSGTGFEEQTVSATVIVTDTLGNQLNTVKQFTYDDDPPVLSAGGNISLPVTTTLVSVVPIDFTAAVSDDGYTNTANANQRYWGVWAVASTSSSLPSPQDFLQYGDVIGLADGATHIDYVRLVNGLTGANPGTRYIHIRFLDGAGNYSETGLTSEAITLEPNYSGLPYYLPLVSKN